MTQQRRFERMPLWLILMALALPPWMVRSAQGQADPFGPAGAEPAKPGEKGKDDESLKAPGLEPLELDPVVAELRANPPTKPEDLTMAVKMMLDVKRPEVAREYLEELVDAKLEPNVLVNLRARFGSSLFLRLITDANLAPYGKQFGESVLSAARKAVEDAARLNDLANRLSDASLENRQLAAQDLRMAGRAAIGPILQLLTDKNRIAAHPAARRLLIQMDKEAIEPLVGVLESDDDNLRSEAFFILGELESSRATPYLVRSFLTSEENSDLKAICRAALIRILSGVPTRRDAEEYLVRRIRRLLGGEVPLKLDHEDRGELWHWNAARKVPEPQRYGTYELSLVEAARLGRELSLLDDKSVEHRQLILLTQLELSKVRAGFDRPLPRGAGTAHAAAAAFGPEVLEDLFVYSLKLGRLVGAVAVAEVLGDVGSEELLMSSDGRPRPLVAAATHADRRLRFAATEAVLKIGPRQPFAGSSYVSDTLGYVAGTVGMRTALVGHPRTDESQSFVGMLHEMGYDAVAAQTGRALFQMAVKQPDCEFLLLSDTIDYPNAFEFLQMLRQDSHTATLTVGIIARPDFLPQAQRLVEHDPHAEVFARPYDSEGMDFVVRRLSKRGVRTVIGQNERMRQAVSALDWIARLTEVEAKYSFYDLRRFESAVEIALQTPELASKAAHVLGHFGSPRAQMALVDLVGQNALALPSRQAAAAAFRTAVGRRGLLLTQPVIALQYDRYNQSESLDVETQQVLSSILDTIERKVSNAAPAESDPNAAENVPAPTIGESNEK